MRSGEWWAIAFSGLVLIHLGMYLPEALHAARREVGSPPPTVTSQRTSRRLMLGGAIAVGLLLALVTIGFSQVPERGHRFQEGDKPPAAGAARPLP